MFNPVDQNSKGYLACRVVEITLERVLGKAELPQSHPQQDYRGFIIKKLAERGRPGDLGALKAMQEVESS